MADKHIYINRAILKEVESKEKTIKITDEALKVHSDQLIGSLKGVVPRFSDMTLNVDEMRAVWVITLNDVVKVSYMISKTEKKCFMQTPKEIELSKELAKSLNVLVVYFDTTWADDITAKIINKSI